MAKALTHSQSESHLQALKNRASLLLAADEATERTHSLKEVWQDGQPPILAAAPILPFGAQEEAIWQQCLIALGRCSSSALLSAKHFLEVTEAGCDANSVPYPHKILRVGYPKPMPWTDSVNALSFDDLEFVLPGARQTVCDVKWSEGNETNVGKAWLQDLAKIPTELRAPMHADSITVDMTLIPWPMFPPNLLIADGHDELEIVQDSQFFQECRYLRACTHQNVQEFDLSLEPWRTMPENVIEHDVCTDVQLTLLEARAKRGPLSETVLARRRANIDPRFFEEVYPTWEKDTALAEMHSRWAKDKAIAAREYDEVAEYGVATDADDILGPTQTWGDGCSPTQPWIADDTRQQAIEVRNLAGDLLAEVDTNDTIYKIKAKVQTNKRIPPHEQRLLFGEEVLNDGDTPSDYNIRGGSTIVCVLVDNYVKVLVGKPQWTLAHLLC